MLNKYQGTIYNDVLVTDILKRVYFTESFSKTNLVENYYIKDDDIPEAISNMLYSKPEYVWYILTLNNIQNKFEEWPLSQKILIEYIDTKYPTSSIVINPNNLLGTNLKLITHVGNNSGYKIKIKNYDKQLCKLITEEKLSNLDINLLSGNLNLYNSNEIIKMIPNNKKRIILDDKFSLNHFYDNDSIIDPYSSYQSNISYLSLYSDDPSGNSDSNVITNYSYEIKKNDDKRNILLLRPEIIQNVVSQFRKIMKGISTSSNIREIPQNTMSSVVE